MSASSPLFLVRYQAGKQPKRSIIELEELSQDIR
jgi:hypothetical protein